jgi:hypothetical protein
LYELATREAVHAGYNRDKDYRLLVNMMRSRYYADALNEHLKENTEFKEHLYRISLIKLLVKDYRLDTHYKKIPLSKAEQKETYKAQYEKAEIILSRLKKGASFASMAREYSDDYSKYKGGDRGYISLGMHNEEFSKLISSLTKGDITQKPVSIANSIYIIKVTDEKTVTDKNLYTIVTDKEQADTIRNTFYTKVKKQLIEDLKRSGDVILHFERISQHKKNTVLFSVGSTSYTIADLEALIDFTCRTRDVKKSDIQRSAAQLDMLSSLCEEKLLAREAFKRGLHNNSRIAYKWELLRNEMLVNAYIYDRVLQHVKVNRDEAYAYYQKYKKKDYTRWEIRQGKKIEKEIPFQQVENRVTYDLLRKKRAFRKREWQAEILKKYTYSTHEESFL